MLWGEWKRNKTKWKLNLETRSDQGGGNYKQVLIGRGITSIWLRGLRESGREKSMSLRNCITKKLLFLNLKDAHIPNVRVWLWLLSSFLLMWTPSAHSAGSDGWSLPPLSERIEFLALDASCSPILDVISIWGVNQQMGVLLSVSVCLGNEHCFLKSSNCEVEH